MASSAGRPDRPTRQDYVARIRYVNNLPPPPIPPKFLNVPGTGLPNDHYTSASYASRLVRDQPINVEADAELGMPIDLVGMPGVFDGDEQSISALPNPPPPHPHDEPLLKPLSALRRADTSAVSFLRKTDYIGGGSGSLQSGASRSTGGQKSQLKRKHDDMASDDPGRIAHDIERSFSLANGEAQLNGDGASAESTRQSWEDPVHPKNKQLKLLDAYPLLPDLHALPDLGSYTVTKFSANPMSTSHAYDERLDIAILFPRDAQREKLDLHRSRQAERAEKGLYEERPPFDYDLFLPDQKDGLEAIKRNRSHQEPQLSTSFAFPRVRSYETQMQSGNPQDAFDDTVALALYDGEDASSDALGDQRRLPRGAYFYPVGSRNIIRPERGGWGHASAQTTADVLDVTFRASTAEELSGRRNTQIFPEATAIEGAA